MLGRKTDRASRKLTFIPNLFKLPRESILAFDVNDPFISPESLDKYCGILSPDGIPKYLIDVPDIDDVIDISDKDWSAINKIQEEREKNAMKREEEEKPKKSNVKDDNKMKDHLDYKVDSIFHKNRVFIRKACPVMIPYKSSLNHEEHRAYLRAFVKFRIRAPMSVSENKEYEYYLRLQNRVYEEQQQFMHFSFQVARLQLRDYNLVPEEIHTFVNEYVQRRWKEVLRYRNLYVAEQLVPICPQDPKNKFSNLYFTHIGHLLSLGCVPCIKLPNDTALCKLPIDERVTEKVNGEPEVPVDRQHFLHKTPVSEDPNAIYLAQTHRANIVISTSALKVIADNSGPNFDKEWDIPVIIRTYSVKDTEGNEISHRVVFVDKPLPRKVWTPIEKKQLFYKKSAQMSMTEVRNRPLFRMNSPHIFRFNRFEPDNLEHGVDENVSEKVAPVYKEDFLDLYSATDDDIFGPSFTPKTLKPTKKGQVSPSKKSKSAKTGKGKKAISSNSDQEFAESSEVKMETQIDKTTNEEWSDIKLEIAMKSDDEEEKEIDIQENVEGASKNTEKREPCASKVANRKKTVAKPEYTKENVKDNIEQSKPGISKDSKEKKRNTKTEDTRGNLKEDMEQSTPGVSNASSVLDALLDMQDNVLKPATRSKFSTSMSPEENDPQMPNLFPWSNSLNTNWDDHQQAKPCNFSVGDNYHYQLYEMGFNNTKPFDSSQPLCVLVRSHLHGRSWFRARPGEPKCYVIYPKPEHQAYFGSEVNTLSEITQQWVELLIRPHTQLLEVRVCESSGEVLKTEYKSLENILKDGKQPHIGFTPQQPMSTMYAVFNSLSALPTGDYLLHHDAKTEAFIRLMKAVDPQKESCHQALDLHNVYLTACAQTRSFTKPPWLAIDTHILTPFHMKHYKIPATFPMENPTRKLSRQEKRKITAKAKLKRKLDDLKSKDIQDEDHY